ncbi:MAG: vWA domain-containing protein [Nostoc sp. SerVER01]|uniref:vWA domain-containing protein n=1 Tax=Nostoc sp. CCY 9925 TaxID=3103865 RepID=UPI002AD939A6|nr:VWA domain-containing protein [Nostoc sp. SerVER01]MDZ8025044.1 VWA domain-containing protein [Nostoc sp. DedQUE11]MDZ8076010.1 VWA domain-containing protein [Nostoc sp. DedQUE01]MDZ8078145.1 VWA domain-containing protein [Nostoc sp. DcaGUA01]MDZ8239357.1 VWA domain-containing protein [Nostoc sp. ChiQUE01a]
MSPLPGGAIATRPLHFIFICDCSGSMSIEGKIQALNNAIKEAIPEMRRVADENAHAQILVRAVKFSDGAQWHIATPTPVDSFKWEDLKTDGLTDMGKALSLVADQLKMPPMTDRALPPVLVLISDGQPTDDFNSGLKTLLDQPWGKRAVRIAIAIGRDADTDVLQKFIGSGSELKPLLANNAETLVKYIKWASTAVVKAASAPPSKVVDTFSASGSAPSPGASVMAGTVPIPVPATASGDADDIW